MSSDAKDFLPVVRAAHLTTASPTPQWLVHGLWARSGVGILGGAPKCCKSWLALDLALSVASGTPCLDSFPIHDSGGVMLYMAEDATSVVKSRLLSLCKHRRISLDSLPIDVITAPTVRIDRSTDQERLTRTVRRGAPRLLVLDPFVRLHRIDENDAGQVSAILGFLRSLQRDLDVAVLVVHHARKNGASSAQAGQNLRGSGDLHAWGDSNLYLRRQHDALCLTIEHRAAPSPEAMSLKLVSTEPGDQTHLALLDDRSVARSFGSTDLESTILSTLSAANRPLTRSALRALVRTRNERLGESLVRLASCGQVVRVGDGWSVPVPPPAPNRERNDSPA